jgi:hypothetical protein
MGCCSKAWPFFDGQILTYIAWKREWTSHHKENYTDLKGDSLKRVLEEHACDLQTEIGSATSHP